MGDYHSSKVVQPQCLLLFNQVLTANASCYIAMVAMRMEASILRSEIRQKKPIWVIELAKGVEFKLD